MIRPLLLATSPTVAAAAREARDPCAAATTTVWTVKAAVAFWAIFAILDMIEAIAEDRREEDA